ncbi:MAG TPA: tripartite tricarboxylate transporter substrate binding protein [Burkholderiales bacterium]|nr:tripartite tricarboxylate transporter substrate binding protein [Burkholderiales bacterium]
MRVDLLLRAAVAALVLLTDVQTASAQWKPEKPVEIVVGTSPGGPQDRTGRTIQRILQDQKLVTTPVNVVNKAGGGGAVGLSYVNQHPGDGHYLTINSLTLITNHLMGKTTMAYTDFTPIAILGVEYVGAFVLADSPVKGGRDLADRLKKDPAALSISIGTTFGNATHLSFALAMKAAGVEIRKLRTVVFNSGGDAMTALLGGHVQVMSSAPSTLLPHLKAGKVRALAIGAPQRLGGDFSGIPTWKELGVNSSFELWRGLAAPKGLNRAQTQFWDESLGKMVKTEEWNRDLAQYDMENVYRASAETARYWKAEHDEVKAVLSELGLVKQ